MQAIVISVEERSGVDFMNVTRAQKSPSSICVRFVYMPYSGYEHKLFLLKGIELSFKSSRYSYAFRVFIITENST